MVEVKKTPKTVSSSQKRGSSEKILSQAENDNNAVVVKKPTTQKQTGLSVGVLSVDGKSAGQLSLPNEIFGVEINKNLLSQAIRVYQTNLQAHHAHTKTRGEVSLTTAKWFRQKGTGRARHGAKSAPIFVGGGVAMGPRRRKVMLDLPDRMKKAALISALSLRLKEGQINGITGLEKATGKTKEMVELLGKMEKRSVLFVADGDLSAAGRATKNIRGIGFGTAASINVYQVISYQSLVLTKEAVEKLTERLIKG